jgi:hypothetical protein
MKKLFRKFDKKARTTRGDSHNLRGAAATRPTNDRQGPSEDARRDAVASTQRPPLHSGDNVGISGCPNCLDLDLVLASKATDGPTEESWARKEYNIDLQTLAGEINLKKASANLQTAQFGCIFCSILSTALNQIRPGWHEDECFRKIPLPEVYQSWFG